MAGEGERDVYGGRAIDGDGAVFDLRVGACDIDALTVADEKAKLKLGVGVLDLHFGGEGDLVVDLELSARGTCRVVEVG